MYHSKTKIPKKTDLNETKILCLANVHGHSSAETSSSILDSTAKQSSSLIHYTNDKIGIVVLVYPLCHTFLCFVTLIQCFQSEIFSKRSDSGTRKPFYVPERKRYKHFMDKWKVNSNWHEWKLCFIWMSDRNNAEFFGKSALKEWHSCA